MAELERLKSDKKMYKAFKNLETSMEDTLQKTLQTVKEIEESLATIPADKEQSAWSIHSIE